MSDTAHEHAGSLLTESILTEAMTQGFAVNDEVKEKLGKPEPEPEVETGEPAQDAIDSIIAGIEAQAGEELAVDESDDEVEEMPDFAAEAEAELLNEEIAQIEAGYEDEEEIEETPADSNARKRAIIAEKKAAYFEGRAAEQARRKWEAEAGKHMPFARHALKDIKAKSRRDFLRQAKAINDTVKGYTKLATEQHLKEMEAERAAMRSEEQAKAVDAWGKPTVDPGGTPAMKYQAEMEKARKSGDLAERIAIMMKAGQEEAE